MPDVCYGSYIDLIPSIKEHTVDSVSAANLSRSRHISAVSVNRASCDRCGSSYVAWVQSRRTGRWYLADAVAGVPGKVIPLSHRPHFKTCSGR